MIMMIFHSISMLLSLKITLPVCIIQDTFWGLPRKLLSRKIFNNFVSNRYKISIMCIKNLPSNTNKCGVSNLYYWYIVYLWKFYFYPRLTLTMSPVLYKISRGIESFSFKYYISHICQLCRTHYDNNRAHDVIPVSNYFRYLPKQSKRLNPIKYYQTTNWN